MRNYLRCNGSRDVLQVNVSICVLIFCCFPSKHLVLKELGLTEYYSCREESKFASLLHEVYVGVMIIYVLYKRRNNSKFVICFMLQIARTKSASSEGHLIIT